MVVSLQHRPRFPDQDEEHTAHMADVVTLVLDVVAEVVDTTTEGPTMTGDLVAVFHQASGGGERHLPSENLAMAGEEEEEEEEEVLVVLVLEEDRMAVGMDGEGEDGDPLWSSRPHWHEQCYDHALDRCSSDSDSKT